MPEPVSTSSGFGVVDWVVVAGYLLATTLIGAKLAGKQSTIRDFFLAGRKLPWWAISGSIIATEISAATIVAVPTISFAVNGNLTYLQLAIGAIIARVIIALYFVPRYYREEIYSPYDYLEQRLGRRVKTMTTLIFFVGAILGQGVRVYVTAVVLSYIANISLESAIWLISAFSVGWTLLGGMTTVIWTDFIQFIILFAGAGTALAYAVAAVSMPVSEAVDIAGAAGKFQLLNTSTNPAVAYTLWCGLLGTPFLNLAAFGTDQVMAQRIFCCRNQRDAIKALLASSASLIVAVLMLFVGIGLFVYFRELPFTASEQALFKKDKNYLLPIFIVRELPAGVRGLIVAAIFAAAISTLESALAALAQTSLSAFVRKWLPAKTKGRRRSGWTSAIRLVLNDDIRLSRVLVVFWGAILGAMATVAILMAKQYANAVDLALEVVTYTYGPMLGIFLLAFLPGRFRDRGLSWGVPLGALAVFAANVHSGGALGAGSWTPWLARLDQFTAADWTVWIACGLTLGLALWRLSPDLTDIGVVVAVVLGIVLFRRFGLGEDPVSGRVVFPAFPWLFPLGALVTLGVSAALGRPIEDEGVTVVVRGAGLRRGGGGAKPSRRQRA